MNFDWTKLAFATKKPVNSLEAVFIAAPRDISAERFKQLIKDYLPKNNIILGLAKESSVDGFDNQPQFHMLQVAAVQNIIDKVNAASPKHKIYTLAYFQRELVFVLEKLSFKKVIFINGSWKYLFHTLPPYFVLTKKRIDYELTTPFANEAEAVEYAQKFIQNPPRPKGLFSASEMMDLADQAAKQSFDNSFQTGVSLGRKKGRKYDCVAWSFNTVVPYQTYAWHFGASREKHFAPIHDTNYYDAVHAEVALIVEAQKRGLDLRGTTLFINLLPCPHCSRMLTQTDIAEIVYVNDHSEGYGFNLLTQSGKKVTRMAR